MKAINGIDIDFDFGKLIRISDIIYFDGPLLSHYISEKGDNYLYYWVDVDDTCNRWLIIRTDFLSIQNYLDRKISLYALLTDSIDGCVYVVDIDSDAVYHNSKLVKIKELPEDYLPVSASYYEFEEYDGFNKIQKMISDFDKYMAKWQQELVKTQNSIRLKRSKNAEKLR